MSIGQRFEEKLKINLNVFFKPVNLNDLHYASIYNGVTIFFLSDYWNIIENNPNYSHDGNTSFPFGNTFFTGDNMAVEQYPGYIPPTEYAGTSSAFQPNPDNTNQFGYQPYQPGND